MSIAHERLESLRGEAAPDAELTALLVSTYSNLGLACRQAGDGVESAKWSHAAIVLADEALLLTPDDEDLLRRVAASYNNLGSINETKDPAAAAPTINVR